MEKFINHPKAAGLQEAISVVRKMALEKHELYLKRVDQANSASDMADIKSKNMAARSAGIQEIAIFDVVDKLIDIYNNLEEEKPIPSFCDFDKRMMEISKRDGLGLSKGYIDRQYNTLAAGIRGIENSDLALVVWSELGGK